MNTTNDKVELTANPCGKALLKVAGKELANECQKIGSLSPGGVALTGPAKLSCKRVYHVRSSPWDNGKGAPVKFFLCISRSHVVGPTHSALKKSDVFTQKTLLT